jgi:DNA-binding HxlR family transcriptional regulator
LHDFTRFDEFQKSLNIAPNMLARRLTGLVGAPPLRRDFRPVIVATFTSFGIFP